MRKNRILWRRGLLIIESDVALLKSGIAWLKHLYKSLDYRVWFLVAGVIITILIGLFT